jgi:hypothetical protein
MFGKQQVLYFLGRQRLHYFIWQALVAFLYFMFGSSYSIFCQAPVVFLANSPLLSFVFAYDEIVQLHTLCGI